MMPLHGPACRRCLHGPCRTIRADLTRGPFGVSPEFREEHARAARMQSQCPGVVVWFGEASQSYRAMTFAGLFAHPDISQLLVQVWPYVGRRLGQSDLPRGENLRPIHRDRVRVTQVT